MINDTINPMGLDLTKNLHGHVRVETRDRWTGRVVDSQEKDNLVTNALKDMMLMFGFISNGYNTALLPIYEKVFGGICLFDNTLTESADNIKFPSSAKLVAYAGTISNASEAIGGSYNGAESVRLSNGFTSVWDFLTSQANGTIASLARTSHAFNWMPGFNPSVSINFGIGLAGTLGVPWYIGYNSTNKMLYFGLEGNVTVDDVVYSTNTIYKTFCDFGSLHMENPYTPLSKWEAFKTLTSSDGSTLARQWTYDAYADNFIYVNGTTLNIIANDGTHSTKTLTGTTGYIVPTEDYYWRTNGYTLWRISKNNVSDIQAYTITQNSPMMVPGENNVVFLLSSNYTYVDIVYPDGTIIKKERIGTSGPFQSQYCFKKVGPFYASNYFGNNNWPSTHYLGTIANLDSPVTKTSSQTMKITYTLTEA